jgi:alpha-2-macroglobulin
MNRNIIKLEEIKDLFGEITVSIDGKKQIYKLKLFNRESFAVTKDKIQDIKFSNIKGDIACKVEALGNKDDLDKNRTDNFSIDVSYALKGTSTKNTNYNQSDVVKVTIKPSFSPIVERGEYEVTYVIPSGFRYIDIVDRSEPYTSWTKSNTEVNGQKLCINLHYDRETFAPQPMVFYIQATQMGEYTVDYIVIKEYLENKLNYINKSALTVK